MSPGDSGASLPGPAWRAAWPVAVLVALLVADIAYRSHTLGSSLKGADLTSEPLDCDEAAYAYIGHRLLAGDGR